MSTKSPATKSSASKATVNKATENSAQVDPTAKACIAAARKLSRAVGSMDFSGAADWVYNPLDYAWKPHEEYLRRFARASCEILLLGMNPGPWGMAQTGVPFGEIAAVRDWLGINRPVEKPNPEHPKRPIEGFECSRSEVSGRRLWGLFEERFASCDDFFQRHFVCNYCPLVFMHETARNITPDKLPSEFRGELQRHCDDHLKRLVELLRPDIVVGVGTFAEKCAVRVLEQIDGCEVSVGRILHPSPASPAANRDWAGTAAKQLKELGVW